MTIRAVRFSLLLLAPLVTATPRAEVLEASDDGFHVRHELTLAVETRDVWRAVTAPAEWWDPKHTWSGDAANLSLAAEPGGCFCESWEDGASAHLMVVRVETQRLLRLEGGLGPLQGHPVRGLMDFSLAAGEDGGTRLTLDYRVAGPLDGNWAEPVDKVLGGLLKRLGEYAANTPPDAAGGAREDQSS